MIDLALVVVLLAQLKILRQQRILLDDTKRIREVSNWVRWTPQ